MNKVSKLLACLGGFLALSTAPAQAAPVSVLVSAFSFAPGSGYGVDANENVGETLLDVLFSSSGFAAQNFVLNAAGDFLTFDVGTVALREASAHGGITGNETDNLNVFATLTFTSPFNSVVNVSAIGTATTGSVNDSEVDLTIDWNPVQVALVGGGTLEVSLNDLVFSTQETLTQTATVRLLTGPDVPTVAQVPEPGSLALAGIALAGGGFVRRRLRRG